MTEQPIKIYPTIGCCGLDCGLCPSYYTVIWLASALLLIPALFAAWLFNESRSVTGSAIFNSLFITWIVAVVFPFEG